MFLQRRPLSMLPAMTELRRELDRMFGTLPSDVLFAGLPTARAYPPTNVREDGRNFYVEAEVPGLAMDDLELSVAGNELTIKGRVPASNGEKVTYHRRERTRGEFERVIALPSVVNGDQVEATLRDGVLTVTLPKPQEAQARKITVKAG